MNKNRFDSRSEDEFKHDIAERTLVERQLFLKWIDLVERETGVRPKFTDAGCGNHGQFIEAKDVTTAADFNVEGFGLIEVKFAKPMLDRNFHLKIGQTKSYVTQGASVLMVIGVDEEVPRFTLLGPTALKEIVDTCQATTWIGFGGKPAYRVEINRFIWRDLK